jgi:hypothetical protein
MNNEIKDNILMSFDFPALLDPGALLIEIMSKSRCSFIDTTSDTRCFIDWDYE